MANYQGIFDTNMNIYGYSMNSFSRSRPGANNVLYVYVPIRKLPR